ncbi:MAG: DegT/DnrJ/EryC1/StrS family aminotransferase [bacterium]|nr:DegT/DnrJ/EryC1/StrS family aminotransferase [bacterium]
MGSPIIFHKTHITENEIEAVTDAMRSGWLTTGPRVQKFEAQFSEEVGATHALAVNSATAALHLSLKAIGLSQGDEVIIPANTFVSTAEVVTYFNAIPVLCDIESDTLNMDVSKLEGLISSKTKAIIPVHFAGQPCDMDEILAIAKKHNLKVIEDAAHAVPATYKNRKVGSIGDLTCFSFYATKTLACGEGGMVTTNNDAFAKSVRINRLHGISRDAWDRYTEKGTWVYQVVDNGYKYNMTDISAAIGMVQLEKLHWMRDERAKIAKRYHEAFAGTKIEAVVQRDDRESAWHLFVIKVENRDEMIAALKEQGIHTSVHFIPIHLHPYYQNTYGFNEETCPVATHCFNHYMSLPLYPGLTDADVDRVINGVLQLSAQHV